MSLKAKMEAVIYASEDPVTLAQMVGLLGMEAQTELDRQGELQASLALEEEAGPEAASEVGSEQEANLQRGAEAVDALDVGHYATPEGGVAASPEAGQEAALDRRQDRNQHRRLRDFFRVLLDELVRDYATGDRGLEIREIAGGFRMGTKPEYHDAVRGFVRGLKPPLKLTLQALETLAVVAYKQPVTAPEVSEIRGVDSGGVLGSLLGRKLISTAGRKQVIGRPILYKTTKDFLLRFGLKDISELPSIEEFEKMAGAMVEQEEMNMTDTSQGRSTEQDFEEEKDAVEPQADGDSQPLDANPMSPDANANDAAVQRGE